MRLEQVLGLYNELFAGLADGDYSNNGVQVQGKDEVTKIAFAVDACLATFERAVEVGADMLFVHHGISWGGGLKRLDGYTAKRLSLLFQNRVTLYAQHLPLDMHPEIGNNAVLASMLGVSDRQPFFDYHGQAIGYSGTLETAMSASELAGLLGKQLGVPVSVPVDCGKAIRRVGIVSGGGDDAIFEAAERGLDCLVTGEFRHQQYHPALELGVSVIAGGHYATETTGPRAMCEWTQARVDVPCVFLDVPTGL